MVGIYKITNNLNGKVYVGKSSNIERRFTVHKTNAKHGVKTHLYNAMRKYGIENFTMEVITECELSELNELEKYYIAYYDSLNKGYNETIGGDGFCGCKRSKDAVEKGRQKLIEWWAVPENKERMSNAHKGKTFKKSVPAWNKGKHQSDETRKKISQNHSRHLLGKYRSEETKKRISETLKQRQYHFTKSTKWVNNGIENKRINEDEVKLYVENGWKLGILLSEESKKKIGESTKERQTGKHLSEETKKKIRDKNKISHLGKHLSEETKNKIGESIKIHYKNI